MSKITKSQTFHQMESIHVEDDNVWYDVAFVINKKKEPPRFVLSYIEDKRVVRIDLSAKEFKKLVRKLEKASVADY